MDTPEETNDNTAPDNTAPNPDTRSLMDPLILEEDELPSSGLLSFYDRLRNRILETLERRGGKLGSGTVDALLLVPDVFILLVRLALDRDVPQSTRLLVGGALTYFLLPLDFLPEAILGPAGMVDDLVLAVAVLAEVFSRDLEPHAEKYWSGSRNLRTVISDVLEAAQSLVGHNVYERLRGLLAKRGIRLDEAVPLPD